MFESLAEHPVNSRAAMKLMAIRREGRDERIRSPLCSARGSSGVVSDVRVVRIFDSKIPHLESLFLL